MARGLSHGAMEQPSPIVHFIVKVWSIAANTFVESVRQPVYAVILLCAIALVVVSPYITMFTLMNSAKFMTDMGLATVMLAGLLLAAFSASSVISQEIEDRTVLTVVSKPVDRTEFILGKFIGVIASLVLAVYLLSLALVLTLGGGGMEADLTESLSVAVAVAIFSSIVLAVGYGIYSNFFNDRPFPSRAIGAAVPLFTIFFLIFCFVDPREFTIGPFGTGIEIQTIYACVMVLWAILILAGIAIAISTRLGVVVNVGLCSGVFLIGLLSDYFLRESKISEMLIVKVLYRIIPNLQVFWMADLYSAGVKVTPLYVGWTGVYALFLLLAFLFLAMLLFQGRQLA